MTNLDDDYFEQFGFLTMRSGEELDLTYGIIEELVSPLDLPSNHSVLFSIVHYGKEIKQTVTPALLNMAPEPPFLITLSSKAEIIRLFDEHRRAADGMDLAHERIAQYLTLWHLARAAGSDVDPEIVAYLARSEMDWARKLWTVVDPRGEGVRLTPSSVKVRVDRRKRGNPKAPTVAWRIED